MSSIHAPRSSSRLWTLFGGAALLLLPGCPGDPVPIDDSTSSSSSSTSTNPPDTTTLDSGCEATGGCGPNDTTASTSSTGPGTDSTSSTSSTGSSTDGTDSTSSTGGESSSSGTTEGVSASTGSSSTGEFESGVVFLIEPDVPMGLECDPWMQDCPVGEKCNAWASSGGSWDATACFPIDPAPVGVGETCTVQVSGTSGIDNCELGAMCWDVDDATLEGTCVALCTGTPDAPVCAAGNNCVIANDGVLILCLPGCDPLLQDCDPGQACYPIGEGFNCAPDASGAAGLDGDPCEYINVCDPGLMCVSGDAVEECFGLGFAGCCTRFCDLTVPGDPCPDVTEECVPFFEEGFAPPGLEDVGVCTIPV